jgi:predicted transcriptional regulator
MSDAAPRLGPLESRIMQVLWSCAPGEYAPVREVLGRLDGDFAYTTVMTVLSRLHDKGLVQRRKVGRGWCYAPTDSADGYAAESMRQALRSAEDPTAALLRFAADLDADDAAALRRLLEGSDGG